MFPIFSSLRATVLPVRLTVLSLHFIRIPATVLVGKSYNLCSQRGVVRQLADNGKEENSPPQILLPLTCKANKLDSSGDVRLSRILCYRDRALSGTVGISVLKTSRRLASLAFPTGKTRRQYFNRSALSLLCCVFYFFAYVLESLEIA